MKHMPFRTPPRAGSSQNRERAPLVVYELRRPGRPRQTPPAHACARYAIHKPLWLKVLWIGLRCAHTPLSLRVTIAIPTFEPCRRLTNGLLPGGVRCPSLASTLAPFKIAPANGPWDPGTGRAIPSAQPQPAGACSMSTVPGRRLPPAPLPLHTGDRMSQAEFHRRYATYPEDVKIELIGGIVYMASPLRRAHGRRHAHLAGLCMLSAQAGSGTGAILCA
jgi:hypothetical protein